MTLCKYFSVYGWVDILKSSVPDLICLLRLFLTVETSEVTRQDSPSVNSAPTLEGGGGQVVEVEGGVVLAGDPGHGGEAQHGAQGRQTHLTQIEVMSVTEF